MSAIQVCHHFNAQPNYGPTGWWQALIRCLPFRYTLSPRRALLWHARRATFLSTLFGLAASRRFCFSRKHFPHRRSTCTAVLLCVRQCTTSGLPHESRHTLRALKWIWLEGKPGCAAMTLLLPTEAHTDDDKSPASEKLVHWLLHRQLVDFFFVN